MKLPVYTFNPLYLDLRAENKFVIYFYDQNEDNFLINRKGRAML